MTTPSSPTPAPSADAAPSYKSTLNLPKTAFPMKADLVQNEPATLKRWAAIDSNKGLYTQTRARMSGKKPFTFHDGPPYANGSIHMGHLMNKCLKDFVVRSQTMLGFDCPYVPGWDCHGLPIEHKVMTELVEAGKMDKIASLEAGQRQMAVRRECQKYAEKFVKLHIGQMERLLTLADYAHPYKTMDPAYEGATLEVLADLVEQGLVYRALKPVHWSVANETALAEAELEYQDREDVSVYVDFEAADKDAVYDAFGLPKNDVAAHDTNDTEDAEYEDDDNDDEGQALDVHEATPEESADDKLPPVGVRPDIRPSFMIWTTTPWTLPANLAVAVNEKFEYALVYIDGNITVMAAAAVERVTKAAKAEHVRVIATTPGSKLVGLRYKHPFVDTTRNEGAKLDAGAKPLFRVVGADYVTLEDGTGLVHTAPGHGTEDYQTGLREGLPTYSPVKADGTYDATVAQWLKSKSIWTANAEIVEHLRDSGHLFHDFKFMHSYPHDWRSKTPVIFRCTEQWFVSVDATSAAKPKRNLREMALAATAENAPADGKVNFVPEWGRNRMRGMLESRPDWCISRQRAWGLPIPAFFDDTGRALLTPATVRAVAKLFREKGSDIWFQATPEELLKYWNPQDDAVAKENFMPLSPHSLRRGNDILDVWFESGSSWNAVLRERKLGYPADLYLEGSDQHRGWFQLSLLPALGATGKPPFKTLLTHGFMVDKNGKKMSKSLGNDIKVDDLLRDHGADVCRWWVCSLSYENDIKVDMEFFNLAGENYRKVRNTLRFMLSNLDDYSPPGTPLALSGISPLSLDAWVLSQYDQLARTVTEAFAAYDFRTAHSSIYDFCNQVLSAVYLAAVKDRLYCDKADAPRRRQTQATLFALTDALCKLLAPLLPHTTDEAYRALHKADPKDATICVHTHEFVRSLGVHADEAWPKAIHAVDLATAELEKSKSHLGVDNPLDAGVSLPDPENTLARFNPVDLADLLGVSRASADKTLVEPKVFDLRAEPRCERSWKRDGTVKKRSDGGLLSDRDAAALNLA